MLEIRAATLAQRSLRGGTQAAALDLALTCTDLTTLEGNDSPGHVAALCARAREPAPGLPSVAAVCVYPALAGIAKSALRGTSVRVAAVAGAFPSGMAPLSLKLAEIDSALAAGADEIDFVVDRSAFLTGDDARAGAEIAAARRSCAGATLKVILETSELGSYAMVRRAAEVALAAGADFLKTSTGKGLGGATPALALLLAQVLHAHARATAQRAGLKLSGGVRTARSAFGYLAIVKETLGDAWLRPDLLRFGASGLLDDLVRLGGAVLHPAQVA